MSGIRFTPPSIADGSGTDSIIEFCLNCCRYVVHAELGDALVRLCTARVIVIEQGAFALPNYFGSVGLLLTFSGAGTMSSRGLCRRMVCVICKGGSASFWFRRTCSS